MLHQPATHMQHATHAHAAAHHAPLLTKRVLTAGSGDVENLGPNLLRAGNVGAGGALKSNDFDKENQAASALATYTRSTRSRTSCAATAATATSGVWVQHQPRRALQEIQAEAITLPPAPLPPTVTSTSTLSSSRRIGVTLSTGTLLSAASGTHAVNQAAQASGGVAAIPSLASLNTSQRASAHSLHPAIPRSLSITSSTLLASGQSTVGLYKPPAHSHIPVHHRPAAPSTAITSSSLATSSAVATSATVTSSSTSHLASAITVPPSFLSGNFTASALSTFCAQSNVSQLTAVQEKEKEIARERAGRENALHQQQQQQQQQQHYSNHYQHQLQLQPQTRHYQEPLPVVILPSRDSPCMMLTDLAPDASSDERAVSEASVCAEAASASSGARNGVSSCGESAMSAMDLCSPLSDLHASPPAAASAAALTFGSVPAHMPASDVHLWGAELTGEVVEYWFESELRHHPSPDYLAHQPDLNSKMREILIDWLHEVVSRFRLQTETMFLAVCLLDRFLSSKAVGRKKLQLVGCVALLLAAKYEEIYIPEIKDFLTISDHAYEREHVLHMESIMLNTLNFQLTQVTPLRFMQRFMNTPDNDFMIAARHATQANAAAAQVGAPIEPSSAACAAMRPPHLAQYLLELTLQFVRFLEYRPSTLAASVVYIVANHVHVESGAATPYVWSAGMERETRHTATDLFPCVRDIYAHWSSVTETASAALAAGTAASGGPGNKCLAIYRKFGRRFGHVNQLQVHRPPTDL